MADSFRCTLITPEKQVLDAQVIYASIPGWDGQVGLMHLHAPLLIKLGDGTMRVDLAPTTEKPQGGSKWFFVGGGFAQMKDDKLTVLTSESLDAEEVKPQDAEASLKEAEARVAISDADAAKKDRDLRRARAMIEIAKHK